MVSPAPVFAPNDGIISAAQKLLPVEGLIDAVEAVGEVTLTVKRDALIATLTVLRDAMAYQQLMEIAGVDYPDRPERFEVVYHLLSVTKNHRIRVKVSTDERTPVPSVTKLWPVAGWLEREVFDMYGVLFDGNIDLRRILTDYGFQGHPFRKDFPLTGFTEMRWSEEEKRVIYEPVRLAQDFRSFDFLSPWEGAQYALPGDEKAALPQAKGAQTPLNAEAIKKADAPTTPAGKGVTDPKVTEKVGDSGAAPVTIAAAKPRRPRKPKGAA